VNPLQKISKGGQSQKGKEKESEVSTGSSEKAKAPKPVARTTPATNATGSTIGKAIQPLKPSGSGTPKQAAATTSAMEEDNPFGPELLKGTTAFAADPVERFTTPPPRVIPDPDTPRSEAGKRMAKDADAWMPTPRDVLAHLKKMKICAACWQQGHEASFCTKSGPYGVIDAHRVLRHPNFQPYLEDWKESRRKRGIAWRTSQSEYIDAGEMVVSIFCDFCQSSAHNTWDCPTAPSSDQEES